MVKCTSSSVLLLRALRPSTIRSALRRQASTIGPSSSARFPHWRCGAPSCRCFEVHTRAATLSPCSCARVVFSHASQPAGRQAVQRSTIRRGSQQAEECVRRCVRARVSSHRAAGLQGASSCALRYAHLVPPFAGQLMRTKAARPASSPQQLSNAARRGDSSSRAVSVPETHRAARDEPRLTCTAAPPSTAADGAAALRSQEGTRRGADQGIGPPQLKGARAQLTRPHLSDGALSATNVSLQAARRRGRRTKASTCAVTARNPNHRRFPQHHTCAATGG